MLPPDNPIMQALPEAFKTLRFSKDWLIDRINKALEILSPIDPDQVSKQPNLVNEFRGVVFRLEESQRHLANNEQREATAKTGIAMKHLENVFTTLQATHHFYHEEQ